LTPQQGWVTGVLITNHGGQFHYEARIVRTTDGSRTWHLEYSVVSG
jgi:hypothetical protein